MENIEKNENTANQGTCACACGCDSATDAAVEKTEAEKQTRRRAYVPAVDMINGENEVCLVVDVPGVPEGGVDLSIEKNILTLAAVPADGVVAGKKLMYSEYGVGEYRRSFALSDEIDRDNIKANLKNGVLRVTLPKLTPVTKKIDISSN